MEVTLEAGTCMLLDSSSSISLVFFIFYHLVWGVEVGGFSGSLFQAPRTDSFNPDDDLQKQKPSWVGRLPKLTEQQINNTDNFFRKRIQSLQVR